MEHNLDDSVIEEVWHLRMQPPPRVDNVAVAALFGMWASS